MGDMADYYLEQAMFDDELSSLEETAEYVSNVTCRLCGRKNLHWRQRNDKWRLFDNRGIHVCKIHPIND
jgi:hypothetical protein